MASWVRAPLRDASHLSKCVHSCSGCSTDLLVPFSLQLKGSHALIIRYEG